MIASLLLTFLVCFYFLSVYYYYCYTLLHFSFSVSDWAEVIVSCFAVLYWFAPIVFLCFIHNLHNGSFIDKNGTHVFVFCKLGKIMKWGKYCRHPLVIGRVWTILTNEDLFHMFYFILHTLFYFSDILCY